MPYSDVSKVWPVNRRLSFRWAIPTRTIHSITVTGTTFVCGENSLIIGYASKGQTLALNVVKYEVTITSLDPPFEAIKPIPVVIESTDNGFVASFVDANIHASGDTIKEAASNLKSLIMDVFDEFSLLGPDMLGPGPLQEFTKMQSFIRKRQHARQKSRR